MITKINIAKQDKFFEIERDFFTYYKKQFANELAKILHNAKQNQYCALNEQSIADNFYDALFDYRVDCYEKHLYCLNALNKNGSNIEYIFSNLIFHLIEAFIDYKKVDASKSVIELIKLCTNLQDKLVEILSIEPSITFDILPSLDKEKNIKYLYNVCRLKEKVKLIVHHESDTNTQEIDIVQIGKNSVVIKTNDEQIDILKKHNNSFILLGEIDKKYYSVSTKILCELENTVVLENINKLETRLRLSRRYARAPITNSSLIHISSENEHISGNLIDISEGGIGVLSPSRSSLEKGQDVVAFVSYEDNEHAFKLNFESSGILTSIIGKEHAFRYGIELSLSNETKKLVRNLVESLNKKNQKQKK